MLKRILVALDFDTDTSVATRYAIEIAQRTGAHVTGLALVDSQSIEAGASGAGLGAMYYAEKLQKQLSAETRAQAHHLLREFAAELDRVGVSHDDDHVEEGVPSERILEDMKYHDLLILGHESHFFYANRDRRTHSISDIVERGAAATLVVEPEHRPIRKAVIAYDGSVSAARAMQKFAVLNAFDAEHLDVVVLNVRDESAEARAESELTIRLAQSYLRVYGFQSVAGVSLPSPHPKDAILEYADGNRADLIVAGAYAKPAFSKFFFGSTTKGLIEQCEIPLFLYH